MAEQTDLIVLTPDIITRLIKNRPAFHKAPDTLPAAGCHKAAFPQALVLFLYFKNQISIGWHWPQILIHHHLQLIHR